MSEVRGHAWVFGDQIDTDLMFPGAALRLAVPEASALLFDAIRPGWSTLVEPGDILVGGRSFGVGSARPVASLLRHIGISAVVAASMSSLFQRNCFNAGLAAVVLPDVGDLCQEGDVIAVDLAAGAFVNETTGKVAPFSPLPQMVLDLIDSGGVLEMLRSDGYLP
ncbi:MAG: 3-isopropylmalate dehydratase small subunit [Acidimicrobiales bacterium]|nr:3-isopropylmalate dehydratase small subunit [Acidimicrobiales bacterium]